MESLTWNPNEDVSATMMRRARCLHAARYSTDASANLRVLSDEGQEEYRSSSIHPVIEKVDFQATANNHVSTQEALWRLWNWVERVDYLCSERDDAAIMADELLPWPAKGLIDAGVLKLLRIDGTEDDDHHLFDVILVSESLKCNTYDSTMRR